jgi:DNA-binding response OmpR family regulator
MELSSLRILIVEDNVDIAENIADYLELTTRDTLSDKLEGFEAVADDLKKKRWVLGL